MILDCMFFLLDKDERANPDAVALVSTLERHLQECHICNQPYYLFCGRRWDLLIACASHPMIEFDSHSTK